MFSRVGPSRGSMLFLGRYTLKEVMAVLAKKSFSREARKKNLWPIKYRMDSADYPVQRLLIYWQEEHPDRVIVDLKIKEAEVRFAAPGQHGYRLSPQRCLLFEWLTLQNPRLNFDDRHPPLPGQLKPGLSLSKKYWKYSFTWPAYKYRCPGGFSCLFHNALLFSRYFQFVNPIKQGEIKAIRKLFSHLPFRQLAWAVYLGCLKDEDGRVYEWQAEEQVVALSESLKNYLESRIYRGNIKTCGKTAVFSLDRNLFQLKCREHSILY